MKLARLYVGMRRRWPLVAGAVMLLGGTLLWARHRYVLIHNLTSETYWEEKITGTELFQPRGAVLKHGNPNVPEVALTFDDGPHPASLPTILRTLHDYGVQATFFLVGTRIEQSPHLAKAIIDEGHEVGNHTEHHFRLTDLTEPQQLAEIKDCETAFQRATGRGMSLLRPPGMRFTPKVLSLVEQMGYTTVSWTDAAKDFESIDNKIENLTPEEIADRVMERVGNGSIILLHDTPQTAEALPRVISLLRVSGYKFVTIPQMLSHLPHPILVRSNGGHYANARLSG